MNKTVLKVSFLWFGPPYQFHWVSVNPHDFQKQLHGETSFSGTAQTLHLHCLAIFNINVIHTHIYILLHYIKITIISILIEISKVCDCTAKSTKHFRAGQNLRVLEEESTFLQVQINLPNFFRLALKFSFHKERGPN